MINKGILLKSVVNCSKELMKMQIQLLEQLRFLDYELENHEWMEEQQYNLLMKQIKEMLQKQSQLLKELSDLNIQEKR